MSLTYTEDPVDSAVIALLRSAGSFGVHVGKVSDSDNNLKTVSAPMPYVVYMTSLDYATSQRLGGWAGKAKDFAVHFAAPTERGAENLGRALRDFLLASSITVDDKVKRIQMWNRGEPVPVIDDPVWNRPDGGAIYFGRMEFYVVAR